ncbi:hypothetical protein Asp14428_69860 [Actinoplanes sp. NBRC 14428]|nr:hypothetical protein Asp14428_69860 [Actinoplanes sp. NBRC 14428]
MADVARLLPRLWDGRRLLQFLAGLALIALAFATPALAAAPEPQAPAVVVTTVDAPLSGSAADRIAEPTPAAAGAPRNPPPRSSSPSTAPPPARSATATTATPAASPSARTPVAAPARLSHPSHPPRTPASRALPRGCAGTPHPPPKAIPPTHERNRCQPWKPLPSSG